MLVKCAAHGMLPAMLTTGQQEITLPHTNAQGNASLEIFATLGESFPLSFGGTFASDSTVSIGTPQVSKDSIVTLPDTSGTILTTGNIPKSMGNISAMARLPKARILVPFCFQDQVRGTMYQMKRQRLRCRRSMSLPSSKAYARCQCTVGDTQASRLAHFNSVRWRKICGKPSPLVKTRIGSVPLTRMVLHSPPFRVSLSRFPT